MRRQHRGVLEWENNGRIFLLAAPFLAAVSPSFAQDSDHDLTNDGASRGLRFVMTFLFPN